ncbi:MAG: TonB-dependent receptor [Flavobacteriales bacterium]|nr:TonB-dependent receptor [Flavobacteriales bacterium]
MQLERRTSRKRRVLCERPGAGFQLERRTFLFALAASAWTVAGAQTITGRVTSVIDAEVLPGANVFWLGTSIGAATDVNGAFTIASPGQWPATLITSFVGYKPDTLVLRGAPSTTLQIKLRWAVEMGPVEIVDRVSGTRLDSRSITSTEIIGQKELKRAACCDLSESFETNATVDVNYSDAISGTKTIRMLGLDGRYAQISMENLPFIRGLSTSYGLTLVPGTWIKDINLSKGIGTAVNGPNAMTGQIDLCLLDPLSEPPVFVNLYGNSQGRMEANVHLAQKTGANSGNLLLLHGNLFQQDMDQNNDGFMDAPRTRRFNVMDRWMRRTERGMSQLAVRYVVDERIGGQTAMSMGDPEHAHHAADPYTVDIRNEMVDVFGKQGFIFKKDPSKSVGIMFAARRHDAASRFGRRDYTGLQESFYASAVYQMLVGKGSDQLKAGLSFQYDGFDEAFMDSSFARIERMPGVFAEYTLQRNGLTVVGGLRADANSYYGNTVSPRIHVKYDFGPLTHMRLSAGHGFRSANPLVENATVLASSRRVVTEGRLGMERSWNFGASFLHKFKWLDRKWAFGVDLYRTEFLSQIVTDLDRDPRTVAFYMLDGRSFANSLLTDVQVEITRSIDLKLSHRWYDVRTTYDGVLRERPFTPQHRGMVSVAYEDPKDHWRFDVTLNIFGEGRIPGTEASPEAFRMPARSPAYSTVHAQLTRIIGTWEVYLGGENITSTLQHQQIIAPHDPFGPYFDASMIWGPTNKAMIYAGVRFQIDRKKNNEKTEP